MQVQLICNATLQITYGDHIFLTDPYFALKYSQEPLIGKSRNPLVDLPFPAETILAGIEMVLVSHLYPDHFDCLAQELLPKNIRIYCQPGDEQQIKEAGFLNVATVDKSVDWNGVSIYRTPGQHGNESWSAQMGDVSGFVLRAESEPTIYGAGDTIWYEPVKKAILEWERDIIITHSSGASFEAGNPIIMDAEQTIEVCRAAPRSTVIAIHMETFDFDTVSRKDLRATAAAEGIAAHPLRISADGAILRF